MFLITMVVYSCAIDYCYIYLTRKLNCTELYNYYKTNDYCEKCAVIKKIPTTRTYFEQCLPYFPRHSASLSVY